MFFLIFILFANAQKIQPSCYINSNTLSCTNEQVEKFNKMLTINKNLEKIFWTHSTIENLYRGIFWEETIKFENMSELVMTADMIESLTCSVFERFSNLRTLDLSFNKIKQLKQCYFESITNLQVLELSNNLIDTLSLSLANVTPNLAHLDLSFNKIETIPNFFLENLQKLRELDISANHLRSLSPIFGTLLNLKLLRINLNLKGNYIKVDPETFAGLNNLSKFSYDKTQFLFQTYQDPFRYLARIPIKQIKVKQFLQNVLSLNDSVFGDHFQNFTEIDLSQLGIETIELQTIHNFDQLHSLSLSENRLKTITANMLKHFHTTTTLNLSMNEIEHFGNDTFYGFIHLKILDLSFNRIKNLSKNQWVGLLELLELKLQSNRIETISDDCFHELTLLKKLDLSDNLLINVSLKYFQYQTATLQVLNLALNRIETIRTGHLMEKFVDEIIISSDIEWQFERDKNEFFEFCLLHDITVHQIQPDPEINKFDDEEINFNEEIETIDKNYELKVSPKFKRCIIFLIVLYILCISLPTWVYIRKKRNLIREIPSVRFVN